jgi:hypothetical protein
MGDNEEELIVECLVADGGCGFDVDDVCCQCGLCFDCCTCNEIDEEEEA